MNDRTNAAAETQAEVATPPAAEQQVQQAAADVQQAEQQAAEQEAKARDEAQSTLKALVSAYRKGETAYRKGLLEAGRLADVYLHQRLTLGDKRAAAVQAIEGQLAAWSSSTVDVNRLVSVYHAFRLLADEPGVKADAVPYGHYRDAWCQLVQRQGKDTPAECWVLLPGLEQRCQEAFSKAVEGSLGRDAAVDTCKGLLREFLALQAEQAKAERQRATEEAKQQAVAEALAREQRQQAEQAAKQAEHAAQQAEDGTDKAALTAAAEQAKEQLLATQRLEAEASTRAEQAAREQARRDQEARDAAERQRKALERQRKARERAERKATVKPQGEDSKPEQDQDQEPATVTGNLLRSAATAAPKDLAGMLLDQTRHGQDPLATLWELGNSLATDAQSLDALLDGVQQGLPQGKARQLLGLALNALRGRPELSPVNIAAAAGQGASANGTLAGASAA